MMEQQPLGSGTVRPALLAAQGNAPDHRDGRLSNESVEVPALTSLLQFQMLLVRAEEYHDVPALAVKAGNACIGKGEAVEW